MPPVFQNITPAPASTIDPATLLQFDVIDTASALVLVVPIIIVDATVAGELVHDWTLNQFAAAYLANSSRIAIANGFRYTMRRFFGWAAPPTLRAWAVNAAGQLTVL